ncbi:hypothetical protein IJG72_05610 [bacterium]|nr:hypothetical protein [bacterium]
MTNKINKMNVQIGESYVVPLENNLQDEENKLKKMILLADKKRDEIIQDGVKKSSALIEEAKQILEQARIESENIIKHAENTAEAESAEIKENARKEGYEDGKNQGYLDGTAQLEEKVKAVDIFAKCQFDLKQNIIKSAELDIINLVLEIARKVCQKSFDTDSDILKRITVEAINKLKDKESITITINPKIAEKIYSISDDLKSSIPKLENIKIIEDNNVSEDGTIVESLLSRVDCRLSTQINQIAEKFMSAYYQKEDNITNDKEELQENETEFKNTDINDAEIVKNDIIDINGETDKEVRNDDSVQ